MTNHRIPTFSDERYFVTLKTSKAINQNDSLANTFDQREYSDVFVKTLIYLIDRCDLQLFGFVILSDQIHLIISSSADTVHEKIEKLKRVSAREIFISVGKKLSAMDAAKGRKEVELRKVFSEYLNKDESVFWGKNELFLPIQRYHFHNEIAPISSKELFVHLADEKRNYLQLGASAFTKLMIDTL